MSTTQSVLERGNVAVITGGSSRIGIAAQVVHAPDERRFWSPTHEDMRARPAERMHRAADQTDPPLLGAT